MDFQSAMETFAEAWAAANTVKSEAPSDLSQASFLIYPHVNYFCYILIFEIFLQTSSYIKNIINNIVVCCNENQQNKTCFTY